MVPRKRRGLAQSLQHLKLRQVFLLASGGGALLWLLFLLYKLINDSCQGHQFTKALCDQYEDGLISGGLCPALCREHTLKLSSCGVDHNGFRPFHLKDKVVKVKSLHLMHLSEGHSLHNVYEVPREGSSMETFDSQVSEFVNIKLGDGDHKELVANIMHIADSNNDAKVSLAEAKTIWALLNINDFFIAVIFKDNEHIPSIEGFCGDMFALENVDSEYLYWKDSESITGRLIPNAYKWGFPAWTNRAKVVVGLLEFTLEAMQHDSFGSFYFCELSERNIGHNKKYDAKLGELGGIVPQEELQLYMRGRKCQSDQDCHHTAHCSTICDLESKECTSELQYPNLQLLCQILEPYIKHDLPSDLQVDVIKLLDRCSHLTARSINLSLEQSLILTELKSLIWRKISDDV